MRENTVFKCIAQHITTCNLDFRLLFAGTETYFQSGVYEPWHEIGGKIGVPLKFVLAIQKYFGLQLTILFDNPIFFGVPVPQFGLPFGT